MIQAVLEFVVRIVASVLLALALTPVSLLVATPVILARALIWPGHIRSDYVAVLRWWEKWSIFIVP